jgi:DUF2905 family protein
MSANRAREPHCNEHRLAEPGRAYLRPPSVQAGLMAPAPIIGKVLIAFGLLITLAGVVLVLVGRVPWIGRLPGDIHFQRGNFTFYFPLATSLLLSVVLTLLLYLLGRR